MTEQRWTDRDGRELPMVVSITFKPEALTTWEEWRMFLVRLFPGSKRPMLRVSFAGLYILTAMTFLGFLVGMAGHPRIDPVSMAFACFALGLLYPFRLWRIKQQLVKQLRGVGPITVELSRDAVAIRSKHRDTRIDWAGVLEVRSTHTEFVMRFLAGDLTWIPNRAFADLGHEIRFREMAESGLAQGQADSTTFSGAS